MNTTRRKILCKAAGLLSRAHSMIEKVCSEEQDAYGNLPESLQSSERGITMQGAIDTMESVAFSCDDAISELCGIDGVDIA